MGIREKKGLDIANQATITRKGNLYLVPSQGRGGQYTVDADAQRCSCPDFEFRRAACKHIFAVSIHIERTKTVTTTTVEAEGVKATVTQTVETKTVKVKRTSYKQDWPAYHAAQVNEKSQFLAFLYELCRGIEEPVQTFGRPRLPLADIIFGVVFRTYSTMSGRRFSSDLRDAFGRGYVSQLPSYNSLFDYLKMESLTPYLKDLITQSSLPLKSIETDFAVDSSGFATGQFLRWFDAKYGKEMREKDWVKVHLMCGVKTNVVTSVEISKAHASDYNYYKPLVDKTAQSGFNMKEVSADKAYLGNSNFAATLKHGAVPYIPFKTNSQPDGNGPLWARIFHFYNFKRDEFLSHYHKRSNVETTFSMIKAKFGERLRCKTETAQINEALCKVLAHNLCCVIQSMYELGVDATFTAQAA